MQLLWLCAFNSGVFLIYFISRLSLQFVVPTDYIDTVMANSTVELKGYSSTTVGSGGFVSSTSPPSWQASSEVSN